MRLPFFSSSNPSNGGNSTKKKKNKNKNKQKSNKDKSVISNPPSSSSSGASSSSPKTVLPGHHYPDWCSSSDLSLIPANPRNDVNGKVTRDELEHVLRHLNSGEEGEVAAMLAEAGCGGEEMISLEEFVLPRLLPSLENMEEELRSAFGIFDTDGDGKISAEELRCSFVMMGDESCSLDDCRRMIGGVDSDGDGFVSFPDFARMMTVGGQR